MREHRRVPISRLIQRLGLSDYDHPAPMDGVTVQPSSVKIPLSQHIGSPATAMVSPGDRVKVGQILGTVPDTKLGVPVHASVSGVVTTVVQHIEIRSEP